MASTLSKIQTWLFTLLRMAIGWHFLYEGMDKLWTPDWTAAGYFERSRWILAPVFHWIAAHESLMFICDAVTIAGLIGIGLFLMLGLKTKIICLAGVTFLAVVTVIHPPLIGYDFGIPAEGQYLLVNKNIIELIALLVLAWIPDSEMPGIDYLLKHRPKFNHTPEEKDFKTLYTDHFKTGRESRRHFLKGLISVPFLGAFTAMLIRKNAWESIEEKNLMDVVTSASVKSFRFSGLQDLKARVPVSAIGHMRLSRLILGGNLIGGWAHARDLIYVSKLVKAYHHRDKVFETMLLAEKCGINTLLTNPLLSGVIQEYWRRNIGKIQFISDCGGDDLLERVRVSIDAGASACYVQGEKADTLVREGKIDQIAQALELIKGSGLPAGIGGHYIETIRACVDASLEPDFWVKTLHHHDYWSVQPQEEHDNVYCRKPAETIAFMQTLDQPWIAFKILAAGAITPESGFRYAFESGADFICVGMYDFQIVEDTNLVTDLLKLKFDRERRWWA
ncbi:DoxX family protein [bacterium]|nr:DoxX family protein [bacterium]